MILFLMGVALFLLGILIGFVMATIINGEQ